KDELFRTHILVAGKMLLWWLIPPGLTEDEYRKYVLCLHESDRVSSNYFIDLGYLSDIPKAEIFGACLWQMNKALDSPFKSVIKFAYLELLLQDTAETLPLFSDKIKCLVTFPEKLSTHKNEELLKVAAIDPYLLLAKEIAAFYSRDPSLRQWDNFIRECLYLKTIGGMQSQKKGGTEDERLLTVLKLMENWDLLPDDYERFTEFHTWKYKQLLEFGTKVHDYLIETYKRLRWIFKTFTKENAVTITQRDLSVLGRKLFTFYEKKPGKIEYICNISRQAMAQRDVTFHITRSEGIDH
ncbi:MAG: class I adenylate cyclase, partial [Deltaproteobacteria bacterium]